MQSSTRFALFWAVVALCATGAQAADGDQVAPFFGFMGAMSALVFSCMGAAYGTAKSGVGIASMGVMRPELVMKSIVPVVMAGVLGIYGLINAVIISTNSASTATRSLGSISLAAARRHVSFGDPPRTSSRAPTRSDPGTPPNAQRTSAFATRACDEADIPDASPTRPSPLPPPNAVHPEGYTLFQGYAHLSSGLACGLSGLAAGMAIGITGDAGVRANAQQPKLFTGILLIFIFSEALALYGLIVGIILASAGSAAVKPE